MGHGSDAVHLTGNLHLFGRDHVKLDREWKRQFSSRDGVWDYQVTMSDDPYTEMDDLFTMGHIADEYRDGRWSFVTLSVEAQVNFITFGTAKSDGVGWGTIDGRWTNPLDDSLPGSTLHALMEEARADALRQIELINGKIKKTES